MAKENIRQEELRGEQKDPNRKWEKDYDASDLEHVFKKTQMHSWKDAIDYLDKKGMNDNELTPGEALQMKQDLQRAQKQDVGFTTDPKKAFQMIHGGSGKSQSKK